MTGNVTGNSMVIGFRIFSRPKLPEAKQEEKGPSYEEREHEPVNNVYEVIDITTVIGVILGNPEPF